MDRFACGYCGNEHIVKRSGGTVRLESVLNAVASVEKAVNKLQPGVNRTANELTIARLKEECAVLEPKIGELQSQIKLKGPGGEGCAAGCTVIPFLLSFFFMTHGMELWGFVFGICAISIMVEALGMGKKNEKIVIPIQAELNELEKEKSAKLKKIQELINL